MQITQAQCTSCQTHFAHTDELLKFYKKMEVPPPTLCPDCRQRRRLAWRNERTLYKRKCSATGADIVSTYNENVKFPVYALSHWWSDKWDAISYGKEYDFSRSFFEQFAELQNVVPRMTVLQSQNENSDYTNCVSNLKDCYLLFSADFNRACHYGAWIERCNDCIDNLLIEDSELAYECVFSKNLYNAIMCVYSSICSDSAFLLDCRNCTNCFMCFGLRNQEYCLFNRKVSKEEYEDYMKKYPLTLSSNYNYFKNYFLDFIKNAFYLYIKRNGTISNSTGDFLSNCENCLDCFEVSEAKDCRYVYDGFYVKDVVDCSYVNGELGYENCECVSMPFNSKFCVNAYTGSDLIYCDSCMNNCRNCFGCIGLRQKQYCILNKQYTKEEYEEIVPRIIADMKSRGEYGEFFPANISPYSYHETEAMNFFPMQEMDAKAKGFRWEPIEQKTYVAQTAPFPEDSMTVNEDICEQIFVCERTGKNFKIIPQELEFYKKMGLPIPRLCPEARHSDRAVFRTSRQLHERKCSDCTNTFRTTYSPERSEKVLCEKCYLKSIG